MVPTSAYGTAYSYTQPGLLVFESFPKRRTPGVCGAMSKMFVGGCWYFLEKCWKTGGKRTRCPRQPIVDMDVDCRRPRHDENYSSLFVENSHPETLHRDMCIACSGSSSGLRLPPLRTMPIHKIVSKERCQSYFIDGCRRIKIEWTSLACAQAPIEVFHSIFAWLVAMLTFNLPVLSNYSYCKVLTTYKNMK